MSITNDATIRKNKNYNNIIHNKRRKVSLNNEEMKKKNLDKATNLVQEKLYNMYKA